MRTALDLWELRTKDLGSVPEKELIRRGLIVDLRDGGMPSVVRRPHAASAPSASSAALDIIIAVTEQLADRQIIAKRQGNNNMLPTLDQINAMFIRLR